MKKYLAITLSVLLAACGHGSDQKHAPVTVSDTTISPYSYDLNKPDKFLLPDELHEISGIAFNKGTKDTIYAEQDEAGRLFHFRLGDKNLISAKFGKKGDYEDVAISHGYAILLRSDGILFSFALQEANNEKVQAVQEWTGLLPEGEFEGLYAEEETGKIYVLCKHCGGEKTSKIASGTILQLTGDGKIEPAGNFNINVREIETLAGEAKISFHPSALAKKPDSGEWYVLSSVNKLLVVTDGKFTPTAVYALNPSVFNQPEGIAFDRENNLYISNEGGDGGTGTILRFLYRKK